MTIDLNPLKDEELKDVIKRAEDLLEERKEARRQKAIDDAKASLAAVGLTFRDVGTQPSKRARKASAALPGGQRYVNPANPSQVWISGRGRRPKWLAELEAKGKLPAPQK